MSKLFTLGVILSAKDMLSPVLKKTDKNLGALAGHTKKLNTQIAKSTKTSSKLKKQLTDLDQKLRVVKSRRFRLNEDFDKGRISAEEFRQKLSIVERQERVLAKRRLRIDGDFKRAASEAQKLDGALRKIERRQLAIERLGKLSKAFTYSGTALAGLGVVTRHVSSAPVGAFADLEEARTTLQMTMMDKSGKVPKTFAEIDRQAVELGNKLPGTTKDFYELAASMRALGVSDKSITGGAFKSAAYLATVLKSKGVTYQQAGEAVAKFKEAGAIADKDMLPFIDLIQRMAYTGVSLSEMQYAYSKLGATMRGMGLGGYKEMKKVSPFIGMLIKAGFTGETVGTNLASAIQRAVLFNGTKAAKKLRKETGIRLKFTDKHGKFIGFENMLSVLNNATKGMSDTMRLKVLSTVYGTGEQLKMIQVLMAQGVGGYRRYLQQMERQASLQQRAGKATSTLSASWEALTGTFENLLAIIGENVAPVLKKITGVLNDFADKVSKLAKEYPQITKAISYGVVGFSTFATVVGGGAIALGGLLGLVKGMLSPVRTASSVMRMLGGASKDSCGGLGCVAGKAGDAAKSVGALGKKTSALRKLFASPLTLTVSIAGAAGVLAGLNEIAKASHRAIEDKRSITPTKGNANALAEKVKRLEERLAAAKGERGPIAQATESFLHGANDEAKIRQLEKLLERAKRNLEVAKKGNYKLPSAAPAKATPRQIVRAREYARLKQALYPAPGETETGHYAAGFVRRLNSEVGTKAPAAQGSWQAAIETAKAAQSQAQALQGTVQTLAARPEQHIYNVHVTVNNAKTDQDVEGAVRRALADAHYQSAQRSLGDH